MNNNYKKKVIIAIIIAISFITVGYSALSTTLNITGTATAKSNTWSINLKNVANAKGETPSTAPTISGTTLSYAVTLSEPGDYYEFTVDVKNEGSIAAKLSAVPTVSGTSSYLTHTVTYSDGTAIASGDKLAVGASKTIKIRVEYKSNLSSTELPTSNSSTNFTVALNFVQD